MDKPRYAQVLRSPDPALPPGLNLLTGVQKAYWKLEHRVGGAGWYWDRFLFLFGKGVGELDRCLRAWAPLAGEDNERILVGRNAYGAILVLDQARLNSTSKIRILDPFQLSYAGRDRTSFGDLFSTVIPDNTFPSFFSDRLYGIWRKREARLLGDNEILAPRVPEDAGGKWEIDNLAPEDLFAFYERTAVEWAPLLAAAARKRKKRKDVWL
jgi:hypothetical protein